MLEESYDIVPSQVIDSLVSKLASSNFSYDSVTYSIVLSGEQDVKGSQIDVLIVPNVTSNKLGRTL